MKCYSRLVSFLIAISICSTYSCSQPTEETFDSLLKEIFPADGPGGAAIVAKKGEILYRKAFGKAHLELDVQMQPDHIFRIGSITKQFTACAILKLVEEGKLSLSDELTKFIPNYPTQGHTISVEHLLTHTSGIRSYTELKKWTDEVRKKDFTPTELIDYFKDEKMDFAPGERFRYNNSGYILLGYIIEKVSKKTYAEYIDESFFQPLNMSHSFYGNHSDIISNRVAGYAAEKDHYQNAEVLSMTQPYAAGSLLSNVDDLLTWYEAVMNDQVINKESLAKALSPYKLNNGKDTEYGYGWFIRKLRASPIITHGGGINGFLSSSMYLPEEKVFVAVLSNCTCHSPSEVSLKLAEIAMKE